jgi:hypothetical protein
MHELYDLGYQNVSKKRSEDFKRFVFFKNAIIVDARFSPKARTPEWNKGALQKTFGGNYIHVKALGNENYKEGGSIKFVDLDAGLEIIHRLLEKQPVIVMCGCWQRFRCHRYTAVLAYGEKYDVQSIPLDHEVWEEALKNAPPAMNSQPGLFDEGG